MGCDIMEATRIVTALAHYRDEFAFVADSAKVTIDPGAAAALHIILAAAIDCIETIRQDRASLEAIERELTIARADIARLEQAREVIAYARRGGPRLATHEGTLVDLSEALARECHDDGRPAGPEGGAA